MHNQLLHNEGRKPRRFVRRWMAGLLACVMGISTSVALAPSAFAQEETEQKETSAYTCGLEEHTHTEECYEKVTTRTEKVLSCTLATQPAAAGEEAVVIVHKHDASCYDAAGALVCALTEREAHTHTDACYGAPVLHVHSESCYETSETPVCGLEETERHTHTDECSGKTLNCKLHVCDESCADPCTVEQDPHVHTDECYQEKVCNLEAAEAHAHTEDCYKKLSCGKTEDTMESKGEPTCGKEELILHSHSVDNQCYLLTYDPNGTIATKELNCQTPVVEEHIHTDACFTTREIPAADVDTLTCGKEESGEHTHTERCHGTWELTCGLEEHTHVEECGKTEPEDSEQEEPQEVELGENAGEQFSYANWLEWKSRNPYVNIVEEPEGDEQAQPATYGRVVRSATRTTNNKPSDSQIVFAGGNSEAESGKVKGSKTIQGTDIENVFDITLNIETTENIENFTKDPDIAVVLVMDVSGSMWDYVSGDSGPLKIDESINAAKNFIDLFAKSTIGTSKIGAVAFGTNGKTLASLQSCTAENAEAFKTQLTNSIGSDQPNSANSYTNIEVGLTMAKAMLREASNANKFIVFLSDGLPTTYTKNDTTGYVPYDGTQCPDEVFYDKISSPDANEGKGKKVVYGTNYSDKGAIQAANVAGDIKNSGIKIFSIGVCLDSFKGTYASGLSAEGLIDDQLKRAKDINNGSVSTIDNGVESKDQLEIFSVDGYPTFKGWLQYKIGSGDGYFAENSNTTSIENTFVQALEKLSNVSQANSAQLWTVADPVPENIEFIGFFDKDGILQATESDLTGNLGTDQEDTVTYDVNSIKWELQKSGYSSSKNGNTTIYSYSVKYRVRLKNEASGFAETEEGGTGYATNGTTVLTYKTIIETNGEKEYSEEKKLNFPIPAVKGYLGDLEFTKQDQNNKPLAGATFTLSHDTVACNKCRGYNKTSVMVENMTATSDENGKVKFTNIPSGHFYTLEETGIPNGYAGDATKYSITVAYDAVTVKKADGTATELNAVTNTALETTMEIGGTKQLTNPDGAEHTFTFELVEVADRNGTEKQGAEPEQKTVTFDTNTNGNELIFTFNNLIYKGSDLENKSSKIYYYKVSEVNSDSERLNADENFYIVEVKVELNTDKTALTATKTIYKNGTDSVDSITFENTLLGSLTLRKQIVGTYPQGETFTFTLQGLPNGVYSAALNGESTTVTVANGTHTVKLGHKESLVIYGIPHGTQVTVTEAKSAYTVRYLVNSSWMQRNGNTVTTGVTTSGTEILFKNYSPYGLPQTGQLNWPIALLAVLGLGCIGGGALMLRRKKGKHEK